MTATHTPGPWKQFVNTLENGWFIGPTCEPIVKLETVNMIDGFRLKANDAIKKLSETEQANAQLIASAPELLQVLKELMPWMAKAKADNVFKNCSGLKAFDKSYERAIRIIQKAEGVQK